MTQTILLADIGGTHARFCLYQNGRLGNVGIYRHAAFSSFFDVCDFFWEQQGRPALDGMVLGVAGMVQQGCVRLTNLSLTISEEDLKQRFGLSFCRLVNDFELQGWGLSSLTMTDVKPLAGSAFSQKGTCCVIGPGTGLGVCFASLDPIRVFSSEAGHTRLMVWEEEDVSFSALYRFLAGDQTDVTCEDVLSGNGIGRLYHFLTGEKKEAEEIFSLAHLGDVAALKAYRLFFGVLGAFCANMALTLKTEGGICLTGDVLRRLDAAGVFQEAAFFETFWGRGPFRDWLKRVPVCLIQNDKIAFLGLKNLADSIFFEKK